MRASPDAAYREGEHTRMPEVDLEAGADADDAESGERRSLLADAAKSYGGFRERGGPGGKGTPVAPSCIPLALRR